MLFGASYDDRATEGARAAGGRSGRRVHEGRQAPDRPLGRDAEQHGGGVRERRARDGNGFEVRAWDGAKTSADASGGKVTLALSGSPVLLVER